MQPASTASSLAKAAMAAHLAGVVEASARIFGNVLGNGLRSGHKVLRTKLVGAHVASYYPTPLEKLDPTFEDPEEAKRVLKLDRMRRRGKGPPKKGQGKRASKRK